jgi:hypothetical protein
MQPQSTSVLADDHPNGLNLLANAVELWSCIIGLTAADISQRFVISQSCIIVGNEFFFQT